MEDDFADDDFGELYADLQLFTTPLPQQQHHNDNDNHGGGDSNNNQDDADGDSIGTDSEDDLNIVLNDDDHRRSFADDDVHGDGLDCVDHSNVASEQLVSSDAHGSVQSNNGVKGGYGSQFFRSKFMKTQGSKRRGDNNIQNQISSSSYFDGFFLPWHCNIYDVNIEKLEEKPWRIPGADITDYFNFGFSENTWKQYCLSLASTREQFDQAVSGSLPSPSSKCEVPKGRAIQVENSVVERQPSTHVRRPRDIDSDVIIQIKVHGFSDKNSGSVNSNIHDLSEEGDLVSGNNKSISSGEHDVLSKEQLEAAKKSEDSSGLERNELIPEVVEVQHLHEENQHSEDAEVLDEEIKMEERVGIDTCSADPCRSEPELSLGDQELSLTSYSDNESEGTEDSIRSDNESNHSPLRSHLVNSNTGLKESLSLYNKTSKSISVNRKSVNTSYYSRNRGPVQQEWRHRSGRHRPCSMLKEHLENDNNVSHIPRSGGRNLSPWGRQFVNYRSEERLQCFGSHKRKYVSYNRETKQSCYYGADKIVDDLDQAEYNVYSDREDGDSFRENANHYIRKNEDKRECFFEQRTLMKYNEDSDWHSASRNHYVDDDLSPLSYRESRVFGPKHSSFPAEDRETQRRIMHHKPHIKDGNCDSDQWFDDEYEFEFLNRNYTMPPSFAEREMESFNHTHEEQFPQNDRALKRYTGRRRHHGRPPLLVDTLWSGKPEDEFPKYVNNQNSYLKYQRHSYPESERNYMHRVNDNFRGHERHKHAFNRGNDWHRDYTNAAENEDCTTSPVDECELYPFSSEVPHWTNNDNVVWHHEGLHPEEDALFYKETPRHERLSRNGTLHARVQRYDIKLKQHQINFSKRDRESFLNSSSKVMSRDHCRQTVLRCKKSVDLINREGKSAKSSRMTCNDTLENVDRGIAEKQKALVGSDGSRKKAATKSLCDNENKKSLQNLPDKRQQEGLDVEEGEIVTEEPSMEVYLSRRDASEGAGRADSVKKRMSQDGNNSELHIGNFDSQKILVTIAKMEKRRERFKQPINMIKEAEKNLKLNTDSVVNTDEIKQHRPARKRRWNGG